MAKVDQNRAPYVEAIKKYLSEKVSPFDVPGHHMGNVKNDFQDLIGHVAYQADLNAPRGLDNLGHPNGVIKEAKMLMADACDAEDAFFLINGTTSGIIAMILATCRANEKIILPRNCHKSVVNALIVSGAMPVYISPTIDRELEIANQPTIDDYLTMIKKHPGAKAVFVINPTYFGAVSDLKRIVDAAHQKRMIVMVDEAHGSHFSFNRRGPISAMRAGADLASLSFHKTSGSLTQSSVLLRQGNLVSHYDIQKALNIINSTSPSSLLLGSLDAARKYMATKGQKALDRALKLSLFAQKEINKIPGFYARGKKHFLKNQCFDYDETKLVIEIDKIRLSGFEVYNLLRDRFNVQMELAETYTLLGIIAIGTKKKHIDHLILALKEISAEYYDGTMDYPVRKFRLDFPFSLCRPRTAYHAPIKKVLLEDAEGEISKESIMVYPPGIPLIIPGEVFSKQLIERIQYYMSTGSTILSDYDDGTVSVINKNKWKLLAKYQKRLDEYYENKE